MNTSSGLPYDGMIVFGYIAEYATGFVSARSEAQVLLVINLVLESTGRRRFRSLYTGGGRRGCAGRKDLDPISRSRRRFDKGGVERMSDVGVDEGQGGE